MSHPIRIFHLGHSLRVGGAEKLFVNLLEGLSQEERFQNYAGVLHRGGALERCVVDMGIPLAPIEKKHLLDPLLVLRLSRYLRDNSIDIIHMHSSSAALWGRLGAILARTPVRIITDHDIAGWLYPLKRTILHRALLPFTQRIVAVSTATKQSMVKVYGLPSEKITIIPNGLDVRQCSEQNPQCAATQRQTLGLPPTGAIIGFVGRCSQEKGGTF